MVRPDRLFLDCFNELEQIWLMKSVSEHMCTGMRCHSHTQIGEGDLLVQSLWQGMVVSSPFCQLYITHLLGTKNEWIYLSREGAHNQELCSHFT